MYLETFPHELIISTNIENTLQLHQWLKEARKLAKNYEYAFNYKWLKSVHRESKFLNIVQKLGTYNMCLMYEVGKHQKLSLIGSNLVQIKAHKLLCESTTYKLVSPVKFLSNNRIKFTAQFPDKTEKTMIYNVVTHKFV